MTHERRQPKGAGKTGSKPTSIHSGKDVSSPSVRHPDGCTHESGVRFTAAAAKAGLPVGYAEVLGALKSTLAQARLRTVVAANAALVIAYWEMGRTILVRQRAEGWGAKVIDRLSADLRAAFPGMSGLSPRNLKYMRAFAEAWPDAAIVQGPLAQIGWYQNITLLDKLDDAQVRLWYAAEALRNGWSQSVLVHQIGLRLHQRSGRAQHNFAETLPPADSDRAAQIFKDPYLFDFLGTDGLCRERELEDSLVGHVQKFLLELGTGFAFVGRQVHVEVGSQDFYIDLLFYHTRLRRYVVVELKARDFDPGDIGRMNLYLAATDDLLKHPDDQPAIGLLLCRGRDKLVVEYALRNVNAPIGVADWATRQGISLPEEFGSSLPSITQIEAELSGCGCGSRG